MRDALAARGLTVWLDAQEIETFESISNAIEHGLAQSKALVAFYSRCIVAAGVSVGADGGLPGR